MFKKYSVQIVLGSVCVLLGAVLMFTMYTEINPKPKKMQQISVILYGDSESRWTSLEQGVRQACGELGFLPSISNKSEAAEQISAIQREIANGASGVIVAADNSKKMAEYLKTLPKEFPVILVETGAGTNYPAISGNDTTMGYAVAQSMFDAGVVSTAVFDPAILRDSVTERRRAFMEKAGELGMEVKELRMAEIGGSASSFLSGEMKLSGMKTLAVLDNESMESAISAVMQSAVRTKIYGVGNSAEVIKALDDGIVSAVCFPNEFNMGYLGVFQLAEQMRLQVNMPEIQIQHIMVQKENMYTPEVERLIFPIIQ